MAYIELGLISVLVHVSHCQNWFSNAGFGTGSNGGGMGSQWGANPSDSMTITCRFVETEITGAVTLRRSTMEGWWWGQRSTALSGTFVVRTADAFTGSYSLVFTERSRVETGCTTDGLGPVIDSNSLSNRRQGWGSIWGWSSGMMGSTSGALTMVDLSGGDDLRLDLGSDRFPFGRSFEQYAGRGLALCTSLTTGVDDREECIMPVACCRLGFDNADAVTPPAPAPDK